MMSFLRYYLFVFFLGMVPFMYGMALIAPRTPLMTAVWTHHVGAVKKMLAEGVDPNEQNAAGDTALHYAAQFGMYDIIDLLLTAPSINVNIQNNRGLTPLMELFKNNLPVQRTLALSKLLDKGANIHLADDKGETVLHWAAWLGRPEEVTVLLKAGADLITKNNAGEIALEVLLRSPSTVASRGITRRVVPIGVMLLKPTLLQGYLSDAMRNAGDLLRRMLPDISLNKTLFLLLMGDVEGFKTKIIEAPETINNRDELGATLLIYAAALGYVDIVQFLLEHGADPLIQTNDNKTAKEIVEAILKTVSPLQRPVYEEILKLIQKPYAAFLSAHRKGQLPALPKDILKMVLYPYVTAGYKPALEPEQPLPPVPAPGGPGVPLPVPPAAAAAAAGAPPIVFNRKRLVQTTTAALSALGSYGLYRYLTQQEIPTNLDKDALQEKLVTALTNKQYEYAYKLAHNNPQAVKDLGADLVATQNIKELIEKTELNLINESAYQAPSYFGPSTAVQLTYLANLLQLLESEK